MSRWYDAPDGWKDRVQAVVCHLFGCCCATAEGFDCGESSEPSGVAQAALTRTQDAKERVRRVARQDERVGVVCAAAPTTHTRSDPAAP